ncbi:MAG: hypothetical protein Q8859_06110 [Bacteroidota bacterium]|nr:hypothetical protein [Bacteroidota bacterium]
MKKQIGIWIDTEKAVIISLAENEHSVNTINSSIEGRLRIPGDTRDLTKVGCHFLNDEGKKEKRLKKELDAYFHNIAKEIKDADDITVFGPSSRKIEFEKFIKTDTSLAPKIKSIENADKMSENQMIAWVKRYYQNINPQSKKAGN